MGLTLQQEGGGGKKSINSILEVHGNKPQGQKMLKKNETKQQKQHLWYGGKVADGS